MRIGNVLVRVVLLAALSAMGSVSLFGDSVDFSLLPATPGNQGASILVAGGDLRITAATRLEGIEDPIFNSVDSELGYVWWGRLGDTQSGSVYKGLGVVAGPDATGNRPISGDLLLQSGAYVQEALIFTFLKPVVADSVKVTLVGLNDFGSDDGLPPYADSVQLNLEFLPITESRSDVVLASGILPLNVPPVYTVDFSTLAGVAGQTFGAFAVEAINGNFGVGAIEYTLVDTQTVVPEPGSIMLLGTVVLGFTMILRKRSQRS